MKYIGIKRFLFFMTVWLFFQASGIMTRTANAQEIIYDIGDIYYFPDGTYGVVCYVEPDNPHRGWVVSMQDVNTTGAFSLYDVGIGVNDLVNSLGLETTYAINAWGHLVGWHFHGYENTRKLRESGHSPAANAVQLYSGWYIPDAMQMRQWYSMMHVLKTKHPSMQIPDESGEDSRKHYWTSTFSSGGIYSQGAGPVYMNYRTGEMKSDGGIKNAHRIRPVRDFQVEDAMAYWGPVDTAVKTGTITVKPSHTTEYPWHVVFMGQVYDGSGWAVVHPKYGVNDNPKTYDTVCASPERYTSVKNPNFTNLDISTPRATPYQKDVTLQTQYGCDSVIRLYYIVNPVYDFYDTAIVCADALPYHWRGQDYPTAGDYEDVYKTVNGCNCDSTYHLHLRVVPLPEIAISPVNPVICEGGSVELNASVTNCRDESYDFMYYDGLDRASTVTTGTQITNFTGYTALFESGAAVYGTGTDAVRVGKYSSETDFEYGSMTTKALDLSQPFSISLAMKGWGKTSGTIAPTRVRVSVDGAEADTVTLFGYITGSADDAYSTYTLYFGAATDHSVITIESYNDSQYAGTTGMDINYTEERFYIDAITIRDDSPCEITWKQGGSDIANTPSVTVTPSVTTTYTVVAKNNNACVNSGEVTVQVDAIKYGVDEKSACVSYTWIDGHTYTASTNTPTWTLASAAGCDSIVTLHLTISNEVTGDTIAFACDRFDWYEHTNITNSTESLTHTFTNASGCDSVVTLHLTVGHSNTGDTIAFACNTFDWYEHTNITNSTESLTHTFTNASGCDSVVTLHLTVGHSNTGDTIAFACNTFDWYEHTNITNSTESLTHTFTNASGCDSVVTLHLTVGHSNTGDTIAFACNTF
ncbi:MAG: hypothetical protein II859_03535, partial [Bacteroidales bacterium]|nr:hypothetical protein [Bacteroidales bacterium]